LVGAQTRDCRLPQEGLVVAIAHGYSEVASGDQSYLCMLRGRLLKRRSPSPASRRPSTPSHGRAPGGGRGGHPEATPAEAEEATPTKPAPGDHVLFLPLGGDQGIIEDILPRRTVLTRARSEAGTEQVMLANLDHAVLVFAVHEPEPHFGMLDRYLALCEHANVDVTICLNKIDLGMPQEVSAAEALYSQLGYRVLPTSATTRAGVASLLERLAGRVTLLTGPSGVGKSSLINVLLPHVE